MQKGGSNEGIEEQKKTCHIKINSKMAGINLRYQ